MDKNIKLIAGVFSTADAREVISSLLQFKISFHQRKSFSNEIRNGSKDQPSVVRMQELETIRRDFDAFIQTIDPKAELKLFAEISIHQNELL